MTGASEHLDTNQYGRRSAWVRNQEQDKLDRLEAARAKVLTSVREFGRVAAETGFIDLFNWRPRVPQFIEPKEATEFLVDCVNDQLNDALDADLVARAKAIAEETEE